MRKPFRNKVALITGAGSGIGRATAIRIIEEGARAVLNDIKEDRLEKLSKEVGEDGTRYISGDVGQEETACSLVREAVEYFGRVDVLVNNAGIHMVKDITDLTESDWDLVMNTNLKSMFFCCKHAIPVMLRQKEGAIVNMASIASFTGQEREGVSTVAYNVSKAGVLQLTKSLATRYAREGIRVNCVCPGPVETDIFHMSKPEETAELWRRIAASPTHVMGRVGQPEEIAQAVLFLASDRASFITGCPLLVDGGFMAR